MLEDVQEFEECLHKEVHLRVAFNTISRGGNMDGPEYRWRLLLFDLGCSWALSFLLIPFGKPSRVLLDIIVIRCGENPKSK